MRFDMKPMQPWYWRSLPLLQRNGSEVFAALFRPDSYPNAIATLLESPYPTPEDRSQLARYSICAGAPRIIDGQPQLWTPPVGEILPFLRQLLNKGAGSGEQGVEGAEEAIKFTPYTLHPTPYTPSSRTTTQLDCGGTGRSRLLHHASLPFTGGWLGWLGYDLAWEIEKLPYTKSDSLAFPTAYWYEPECFAVLDHSAQILWLAASAPQQLDELQERLKNRAEGVEEAQEAEGEKTLTTHHSPLAISSYYSLLTTYYSLLTHQEDYETTVRRAKKYIQAGDIFQANLSLRFEASTIASSWQIYQALQQINPSPFASYWQTPWGAVISCSPERLVQLQKCGDGNFRVSTRPIAGTRSRGATPEQDRDLAQELSCHTKEMAEHIMLVDLERNDLGRVCQWGSVVVDELLTIERYSHVMHLVSNITGTLKPEYDAIDVIRAVFPGGTITGCPKVRCMEIIEELEPVRRSLFYGSCGYLDWRGNLDLNILIRTLLTTHSKIWGQVGAGIVADSDPEREWYESLHKAQAQFMALKKAEE